MSCTSMKLKWSISLANETMQSLVRGHLLLNPTHEDLKRVCETRSQAQRERYWLVLLLRNVEHVGVHSQSLLGL